ncbi:hypothetical protein ACIGCM_05200 [Pseudomonas sp. NPDC078700]|uniref:hypothetical protein n=1 Tax=Pseudomonas sp. NPDC078700 TaxID=3364424 RepID=UPI0037CCA046
MQSTNGYRSLTYLGVALLLLWLNVADATQLFYLGQRIPDIRRPWSSAQYQQLIEALQKVNQTQTNALPRRSGEFTGPIYQRMVSPENLQVQLNIYRPLEARQNEARESLFQLKELMRLFFDFKAAKQPYAAEALGLMSYSLNQQRVLFTLTTEFWMTLSPNQQRNPVRLSGLAETKAAAALLTKSALDYLAFTAQFGRAELAVYSAELSQQLPRLFVHLPGDVRQELLQRVNNIGQTHIDPTVRSNIHSMQPVLQVLEEDMLKQLRNRKGNQAEQKLKQQLSLELPKSDLPF